MSDTARKIKCTHVLPGLSGNICVLSTRAGFANSFKAFARAFESMCVCAQMSDPVKHLLALLCPWRKKLPICCGNSLAHADQINRFSVLKAGQDPEKH